MPKLTRPLLEAMRSALNVALAGGGFDGGDFADENRDHFQRALDWADKELEKRAERPKRKAPR